LLTLLYHRIIRKGALSELLLTNEKDRSIDLSFINSLDIVQSQTFEFLFHSDKSGKKRNKFFRKERVESSKG